MAKMPKEETLDELNEIINKTLNKSSGMFYRDVFAMACYLYVQGEVAAGEKMLNALFDELGRNSTTKRYFNAIIKSVEYYPEDYARRINANLEINNLF